MLTTLRAALLAVCLIIAGALPAAAQQAVPAPAPAPAPAQTQSMFSVTADQVGAIAIGAVAGAVLFGGGMGRLTGALIGGVVGYWWSSPSTPTQVAQGG